VKINWSSDKMPSLMMTTPRIDIVSCIFPLSDYGQWPRMTGGFPYHFHPSLICVWNWAFEPYYDETAFVGLFAQHLVIFRYECSNLWAVWGFQFWPKPWFEILFISLTIYAFACVSAFVFLWLCISVGNHYVYDIILHHIISNYIYLVLHIYTYIYIYLYIYIYMRYV